MSGKVNPPSPHFPVGRLVRVHPVRLLQHQLPQLLVEWRQIPGPSCAHAGEGPAVHYNPVRVGHVGGNQQNQNRIHYV